jgi:hypothetical protein
MTTVRLGYEIPTGEAVEIPIRHTAVTGQTQESGKTTTLEALISRSGLTAIAFITKRGESSFQNARIIPPYFRERADWQFVSALLEATLRERLKFERSWIMRVSRGARSLLDVHHNVQKALETAKGLNENVYMTLDAYLQIVIPQIEKLPYKPTLSLSRGLNVIDLGSYSTELQALVIRSVLEWVYENEHDTVVIIPEAWEFIPLQRNSPVRLAAEIFIRKSAGLKNYLWLDSQDIAGVASEVRRQIAVWILGVQRDEHEIARALRQIPQPKPKADDVMTLGKGVFFACFGKEMHRTYVQPAWLDPVSATRVAMRKVSLEQITVPAGRPVRKVEDDAMFKEMYEEQKARADRLEGRVRELESMLKKLPTIAPETNTSPAKGAAAIERPAQIPGGGAGLDQIWQFVREQITRDPALMALAANRPEIEVATMRPTITMSDDDNTGRIALLLSEGFFDGARRVQDVYEEFRARGWMKGTGRPTDLNMGFRRLNELGFLRLVGQAVYQAVPGMKVRIREMEAA